MGRRSIHVGSNDLRVTLKGERDAKGQSFLDALRNYAPTA